MSVDRDTVLRIAHLARIRVGDEEADALTGDLNNILGWVEQLGEVDTDGVAPMTSVVAMAPALRADAVTDGDRAADVVRNAPDSTHGFFVVPKVVE